MNQRHCTDTPSSAVQTHIQFYNELIFESTVYLWELPYSVEAFFYTNGNCKGDIIDGPKCAGYARTAHRNFLTNFGLTSVEVPLLRLDLWNWEQPFEDVSEESGSSVGSL